MSAADRVLLYYVKETVPGTTPVASPAFKYLKATGESMKSIFQTDQSKILRPDRGEDELIQIGASVGGSVNSELFYSSHQDFMLALMCQNAWAVDDAKNQHADNGTFDQAFSLLKQFPDLATQANHLYKGLRVNGWSLNLNKKAILTQAFELLGMGFANGAMPLGLTTPTFGAQDTDDPYNGAANISSILLDSVPFTSCIDQMSIQVTNNLRPQECLGSLAPTGYTQGKFQVTMSGDIYFKDETLFNKYQSSTGFAWDIWLTDSQNRIIKINLPKVKFEDFEVLAGGTGQDVIAKWKARALFDPTTNRVMRLATQIP
jgi:hypothetical protein